MKEEAKKDHKDDWEQIMGGNAPESLDTPFMEETARLFTEIWNREALNRRERRLISLTAVAGGAGASSGALEYHIKAALEKKDLTKQELDEWVLHLAYYGSWPVAANASLCLGKVLGGMNS